MRCVTWLSSNFPNIFGSTLPTAMVATTLPRVRKLLRTQFFKKKLPGNAQGGTRDSCH